MSPAARAASARKAVEQQKRRRQGKRSSRTKPGLRPAQPRRLQKLQGRSRKKEQAAAALESGGRATSKSAKRCAPLEQAKRKKKTDERARCKKERADLKAVRLSSNPPTQGGQSHAQRPRRRWPSVGRLPKPACLERF